MRVCVEQRRRRSGVVDVERNSPNPADVPYRPDDGSKSAVFGKGIGEYRADVKWIHYDSRPHLAAARLRYIAGTRGSTKRYLNMELLRQRNAMIA